MTGLDDLDLERLDPDGMLATVERSGAMWDEAVASTDGFEPWSVRAAGLVVAGMGGSGIAGDVARLASDLAGTLPVRVVKDYRLPAWVGPDQAVVAVSYSGNTVETLSATAEAADRGCTVAAVTSGGELARLASERGWWCAEVPGGQQPRASLPYLAVPVMWLLDGLGGLRRGTLGGWDAVGRHVDGLVRRWAGARPAADNLAKQVAADIHGTTPVFYGASGVGALVAVRAKCQVNENAAVHAFCNEVPERDHNEIVGWNGGEARFAAVEIRSPDDEPAPLDARFDAAADGLPAPVRRLDLHGSDWLARLAGGVVLVDLVSVYLAFLHGVDPTPVEPIERLKRRLSGEDALA